MATFPPAPSIDMKAAHLAHGAQAYVATQAAPVNGSVARWVMRDGLAIVASRFRLSGRLESRTLLPPGLSVTLVRQGSARMDGTDMLGSNACALLCDPEPVWRAIQADAGHTFGFVTLTAPAGWLARTGFATEHARLRLLHVMPPRVAQLAAGLASMGGAESPAQDLLREAAALEVLGLLLAGTGDTRETAAPRASAHEQRAIAELRAIIASEFHRDLTLSGLARRVGLGLTRMKILHRTLCGAPVAASITEARLQHARGLLAGGQLQVAEVAYAVGYTPSHFATAFRRRFGMSPGAARPRG